jgi:endonuclease/exonuclease/phosphatase (EEP) superfamily protein YafD
MLHALPLLMRLMTYNVNYGNPDPKASLDAIATTDPDIVLLQEITSEWRNLLDRRFKDTYAHRVYHVGGAGGIAVLSKHPITKTDLWYPRGTGAYFPAQRVIVDSPLGALQLLNVHLRPAKDGGSWIRGFMTTPPVRRREIEAHWKKVDGTLPTIVAGDFNEDPDGLAIGFLATRGLQRVPTAGPRTWHYEQQVDGKAWDLLKMDIDHVVIDTSRFEAKDAFVMDVGASDHRPVVVTLQPK